MRRAVTAVANLPVILVLVFALLAVTCRSRSSTTYVPGLGEIMTFTQMRHIKLWFAGEARNWPLADYEIEELEEGLSDAARFHPTHPGVGRPLPELIAEYTNSPLRALRSAVRDQDMASFMAAYDSLTMSCNTCHEAAGFGFNVITRPTSNPYPDQQFGPTR